MLYSNTYEPDESMTNYKSYMEALPKLEEIQQWHSVIRTEEAEKEQIVRWYKFELAKFEQAEKKEVIIYDTMNNIEPPKPVQPFRDVINQPVQPLRDAINPPTQIVVVQSKSIPDEVQMDPTKTTIKTTSSRHLYLSR